MLCIGHRGAMGHEPENTLRSVKHALELGAPWIEIDVHLVAGRLIVIHDDRLERTTNGQGYVSSSSLPYLRSLNAGQGEKVPFLDEVFEVVDRKAGINIELKGSGTAEPTARFISSQLAKHWSYDQIMVSSFNHHELHALKQIDPKVRLGALIMALPITYAAFAQDLGAFSVNPCINFVDNKFIDDAHTRGLKVYVFTVNHAEEIKRMGDLGVDGVFTNYPERVLEYNRSATQESKAADA